MKIMRKRLDKSIKGYILNSRREYRKIKMKKIIVILILSFLIIILINKTNAEENRLELNGFLKLEFFQPHNEFSIPYPEPEKSVMESSKHSRYAVENYTEIEYMNIFVYLNPYFYFGRTLPQKLYTMDMNHIATNLRMGIGYKVTDSLEIAYNHGRWLENNERMMWNSISLKIKY